MPVVKCLEYDDCAVVMNLGVKGNNSMTYS